MRGTQDFETLLHACSVFVNQGEYVAAGSRQQSHLVKTFCHAKVCLVKLPLDDRFGGAVSHLKHRVAFFSIQFNGNIQLC